MLVEPGKVCPLLFFLHRDDSDEDKSVYAFLYLENPPRTINQIAKGMNTQPYKIRKIQKRFESYLREQLWSVPAPFDVRSTSNAWHWRRYWHGKHR